MKCPKCGGVMSFSKFMSLSNEEMPWSYEGWRCVYCGEIIDPLILLNRKMSATIEKSGHGEKMKPVGAGRGRRRG